MSRAMLTWLTREGELIGWWWLFRGCGARRGLRRRDGWASRGGSVRLLADVKILRNITSWRKDTSRMCRKSLCSEQDRLVGSGQLGVGAEKRWLGVCSAK